MAKRYAKREEATKAIEEAKEIGTTEEVDKFSRRTVKVTKEHNEECKKLLGLMGVPYVTAPCEAEAQCAALARAGKVISQSTHIHVYTYNRSMQQLVRIWILLPFGRPFFYDISLFQNNGKFPLAKLTWKKF